LPLPPGGGGVDLSLYEILMSSIALAGLITNILKACVARQKDKKK
jgi:hypothetical protein